jgi:glycosyltransferase involved in cell wall biosynthesis
MKRLQPQVVHLHSSKAGLAGRLAVPTTSAVVLQPHAWSFRAAQGLQRALALAWERFATRWADAAICVSEAERAEAERYGLRFRRIDVVTNAVDTKRFVPRERQQARAQLGLPAQSPLAVCVGRLSVQKGFDLMLSCWRLVTREVPEARLVLVGDGPDRSRLESQLGDVSGVSLVGASVDPVAWYAAADVVAVPSRWEGMALVPLEAMACERSLVGFDVEGLAECIGELNPPALVPVGDVSGLSKVITRRLVDPELCAEEGRRHLHRVTQDPGWERVVEATSRIYTDVLALRSESFETKHGD